MPTAKLFSVHGGRLPDTPDADIIEALEELLVAAKRGDLIAFGYATVSSNMDQATGWVGASGTRHPLGTAISILQRRYVDGLQK